MASHKILGSPTDPALISIKVVSALRKKAQKSSFLRSVVLKRQRGALGGAPRSVR